MMATLARDRGIVHAIKGRFQSKRNILLFLQCLLNIVHI